MSSVYLRYSLIPCIADDVILWHVEHGWVFDVVDVESGRPLGVVYCSIMPGFGCAVHFEILDSVTVRQLYSAFQQTFRMLKDVCWNILAPIPAERKSLQKLLSRLGFRCVADGEFLIMLWSCNF